MLDHGERVRKILGTRHALVQAPMSWITDARLVSAVSNAGGLGVLGPHAGHDTVPANEGETVARICTEIRMTRAATDHPFGINIIFMGAADDPVDSFNAMLLEVAIQEGVKHFVSVGNANARVFRCIKFCNGTVIHRPLTPTVANMREAEAMGADLLVATGHDEGGHLPLRSLGTFTVVPTMAEAVRIPVLAAGGINDRRGVQAAFALGAQGVFVGTRFIATRESPAADATKELILASGFDDMVSVSPMQRSIRTHTADRLAGMHANPSNCSDLDREIAEFGGLLPAMRAGQLDSGIVSVNTGIDVIDSIPTVEDLVAELMHG